jgi:RHS repeat-associated protein
MQWRSNAASCGTLNAYRLIYDKGNRLLNANHWTQTGAVWANTDNYSENNISYDLNGNIKTLNRRGLISGTSFGQIDQLSYVYNVSNMNQAINNADKLLQVTDNALLANQSKGFKPITGAADYEYDANGNMTKDNNKTVTITYNHLNLPTTFTVNGSLITMTYTADGEKLTKVAGANTKNYVSGIEYKGAALEAIYTSEGRCVPTTTNGSAFFYEYTIKDHLGNARVSFRANGAAVSVIQENHYCAFGMEMEGAWATQIGVKNNYEYNGKELNEDFGLNLSDYGARWYDAAIGRWWSVDPLAEKFLSKTSYNYGMNNPIIMVDPSGMESEAYSFANKTQQNYDNYMAGRKYQDAIISAYTPNSENAKLGLGTSGGQKIQDLNGNEVEVDENDYKRILEIQAFGYIVKCGGQSTDHLEGYNVYYDDGGPGDPKSIGFGLQYQTHLGFSDHLEMGLSSSDYIFNKAYIYSARTRYPLNARINGGSNSISRLRAFRGSFAMKGFGVGMNILTAYNFLNDASDYSNGEISGLRYSYKLTGGLSALGIGAYFGPIAGLAVSAGIYGGELTYDVAVPFTKSFINNFNYAFGVYSYQFTHWGIPNH